MTKQQSLSSSTIILFGMIALLISTSHIADYRRISAVVSSVEPESGTSNSNYHGKNDNYGRTSIEKRAEEVTNKAKSYNKTQGKGDNELFDTGVGGAKLDGGNNGTLSTPQGLSAESPRESTIERERIETESRSTERIPSPKVDLNRNNANQVNSLTRQGNNSTRIPRFLWGIITMMDSPKETERQQALRETYLSYFKTIRSNATRDFICSLDELIQRKVNQNDCYVIYAFVVGANASGPTHLMATNDTESMTVNRSTIADPVDDMIYLNIQENMNDGKSESWFKYATRLLDQDINFDYIVKTDSDTLVFPDRFFNWVEQESLPSAPHNRFVYGGYPYRGKVCGYCDKQLVGSTFMGGELYFMSPDLARFITSPSLDRNSVWIDGHEDISIGNYVYSYTGEIHVAKIGEPRSHSVASHPMKDVGRLRRNFAKRRGWRRRL